MSEEARFAATGDIAGVMMARIASIVPVLPVPLIATVFDRAGNEALSRMELMGRVQALIELLIAKGVHVHIPRRDIDYAVEAGLRILTMRHLVLENAGLLSAAPKERVLIRYYANSIAHHFMNDVAGQAGAQSNVTAN